MPTPSETVLAVTAEDALTTAKPLNVTLYKLTTKPTVFFSKAASKAEGARTTLSGTPSPAVSKVAVRTTKRQPPLATPLSPSEDGPPSEGEEETPPAPGPQWTPPLFVTVLLKMTWVDFCAVVVEFQKLIAQAIERNFESVKTAQVGG
jgi:hypothetical protein